MISSFLEDLSNDFSSVFGVYSQGFEVIRKVTANSSGGKRRVIWNLERSSVDPLASNSLFDQFSDGLLRGW